MYGDYVHLSKVILYFDHHITYGNVYIQIFMYIIQEQQACQIFLGINEGLPRFVSRPKLAKLLLPDKLLHGTYVTKNVTFIFILLVSFLWPTDNFKAHLESSSILIS